MEAWPRMWLVFKNISLLVGFSSNVNILALSVSLSANVCNVDMAFDTETEYSHCSFYNRAEVIIVSWPWVGVVALPAKSGRRHATIDFK